MSRFDERAPVSLAFGDFEFDEERWELRQAGVAVAVPPKVMQTLGILLRNRDRLVTNEELFAALWPDVVVTEASLAKSIRIARRVLGDDGNAQTFIKTTRGRGYRFVAPVRELGPRRSTRPPPQPGEPSEDEGWTLDPPFIGREAELRELRGALHRAFGGRGTVVLVQGDVGTGKTRLVESFTENAVARGARVVFGRCCEEGGAPELWPWRQIVRNLVVRDEARPEASTPFASELGRTEDAPNDFSALRTEAARFRFFDSIATAIRRAAEEAPLVLVIEDLQSSDGASLALARFLARELAGDAVVLIGTYRPSELEAGTEFSESIARLVREARTLTLRGLTEEETAKFLEATFGAAAERALASKVHRVTEGNPLFLCEVARQIRTDLPQGEIELPGRIVEVIRGRLDSLSSETRHLLSQASVIGREFDLPVLERVSELDRRAVVALLEPALDRRIVVAGATPGGCRFAHTLFRDVLYDGTGIAERAALHLRTGAALEALSPAGTEVPAAQLAHHFRMAAGGSASSKAAKYAMEAGNQALRSFAFSEAVRYFDMALEALRLGAGDEPLVLETLTSLGNAHRLAGNYAGARVAYDRALGIARERRDAAGIARAALGFAQVHPETGNVNREAIQLLREVVSILESSPGAESTETQNLLSMVLSRLATSSAFAGRTADAEQQSGRALEIARAQGEPHALARALEARHWVLWRPGTAVERLAIAVEMLELGRSSLDASFTTEARVCEITDLLELGRRDAFDHAVAQYEHTARLSRDSNALYNVRIFETTRSLLEGHFEAAERTAEEALPVGAKIFLDNARNFYSAEILWIRLEQGRAHEIVDVYRAYFASEPASPLLQSTIVRLLAEIGDRDATRAELDAVFPREGLELREDWSLLPTLAHLAVACDLLEDGERARVVRTLLAPFDGSHAVLGPAVVYLGPVAFYIGLCDSASRALDDAVLAFERASYESERVGARAAASRIDYHLSRTLARRRRPEDATRALEVGRRSSSTSRELGMAEIARRAEELCARLERSSE